MQPNICYVKVIYENLTLTYVNHVKHSQGQRRFATSRPAT